jgi:hypothetical protein
MRILYNVNHAEHHVLEEWTRWPLVFQARSECPVLNKLHNSAPNSYKPGTRSVPKYIDLGPANGWRYLHLFSPHRLPLQHLLAFQGEQAHLCHVSA